jgi:Copper type II ascorbate-dependent monooxygenase, C-terminal domain
MRATALTIAVLLGCGGGSGAEPLTLQPAPGGAVPQAGSAGGTAGGSAQQPAAAAGASAASGGASSTPPMQGATPAPAIGGMGGNMAVPAPIPGVDPVSDWRMLVEGAWELPAGEEGYRCARLTLTEDIYIKEFQPVAPTGTHHTLLSVNEMPVAPDGVAACTAGDNGHTTLLGSGVGENYSAGPLPDGVAYKVAKGSQLNLNLHLYNTSDTVLRGTSGIKIRTTTADKVKQLAEVILAGPLSLSIPQGRSTTKGQCTVKSDTTVFAISPHMHQLGSHLKAVANRADGGPVLLYDGPYDFYEQRQYSMGLVALKAGDKVSVECTYENPSDRSVGFGESSLDEMCFIGLYRYPVAGEGLICAR